MSTPRRGIRWWPALVVLVGAAAALLALWLGDSSNRQMQVTRTGLVVVLAGLLLVLWALALSRLPGRMRLVLAGSLVAALILAGSLVRIEGVTGDLVPILAFRFGGGPELAADVAGSAPVSTSPNDSPQFLGPRRDGIVSGLTLATDWSTTPPRELWRIPVGDGWSGFAVVGDAAVTQEQRGDDHAVVRYDLRTGETVWVASEPEAYRSPIGGDGPRTTPTVAGGRVYAFGPQGVLRVHDLADGALAWRRDVATDLDLKTPDWGFASAPLLVGDLVVVALGESADATLAAYRRSDGELAWAGGDAPSSYSAPKLATFGGVEQILSFNAAGLSSHDPADGSVLWSLEWSDEQPNVALPVVLPDDRVLVSTGYGVGSALFRIVPPPGPGNAEADATPSKVGWTAEELWRSRGLKAKFTNPVWSGEHIYGLDDGILVALDVATGERAWKRGRFGHGQTLLVDDVLLVTSEKGEIVLVDATPEEYRELARLDALDGKSWNPPALAGRLLLVRNGSEAVAYELPGG
ncbi:MAG: PQQ-binding-like beta-propeller repeat protein [Acidobacteriota bacterium]